MTDGTYGMEKIKTNIHQRIINALLLNSSFIDNLGLLNGKMGISIFFFHLARETGNSVYEDYAGELIDEIYEEINVHTPFDFENGLAGIGWGIEYLAQNGFIEADTDEVLEEFDKRLIKELTFGTSTEIGILNGILGTGYYFLNRIGNRQSNCEKKQILLHLIEELDKRTGDVTAILKEPSLAYLSDSLKLEKATFNSSGKKLGVDSQTNSKKLQIIDTIFPYQKTGVTNNFDLLWDFPILIWFLAVLYEQGIGKFKIENTICRLTKVLIEGRMFPKLQSNCLLLALALTRLHQIIEKEKNRKIAQPAPDSHFFPNCPNLQIVLTKLLDGIDRKIICSELPANDVTIQHGTSGIAWIYQQFFQLTGDKTYRQEALYWQSKIEEHCVNNDDSANFGLKTEDNAFGVLKGLAGPSLITSLTYNTTKNVQNTNFHSVSKNYTPPLHIHPSKTIINLFFVILDHSGARTYANELLGYLLGRDDISVHKVYFESEYYKEYSIIKEKRVTSIHIPAVKLKRSDLDKHAQRCTDLIAPYLYGMKNLVFHLNYGRQVRFGMAVRKRFGAKLVYTLHFLPNFFSYLEYSPDTKENLVVTGDVLDKEILEETDKIICISNFAQKAICNHYEVQHSKTQVIYNGFGNVKYRRRSKDVDKMKEQFGFHRDERIILFAGRLSEDKGIHTLIKAFKRIHKEFECVRLVLAGNGDFSKLFLLCKRIFGKVTFMGQLPLIDLQQLYRIAEIGVCPSRFELLGYTPIEMMAQQLPVVISNVPGMNELINDGIDGMICSVTKRKNGLLSLDVHDEKLYEKIKVLLENKDLAKKIAQNGKEKWKKHYTAGHMGEATMTVYKQIVLS